jgi:uncharacterized damage-inducible protein DinB
MTTVETLQRAYRFNRDRTLGLIASLDALPNSAAALAWRPGPGRAHIGWQLTHIAITEEIMATERLNPQKPPQWTELWPRFRGGSTPDDHVPSLAVIRDLLAESRSRLLDTLSAYGDDRLSEIPTPLAARKLSVLDVLHIIAWHEGHHQGQAHLTLNLYKAATGAA